MKYISTYEGLFNYFSKSEKMKREIVKQVKSLITSNYIQISGHGEITDGYIRLYYNIYIKVLEDGSVDVLGDLYINSFDKTLSVKFNKINGDLSVRNCWYMKGFDNLPSIITGNCTITDCGIDSFKDLPIKKITGKLDISNNNIQSLEGIPDVDGEIEMDYNDIYSLDIILKKNINFTGNPIESISLLKDNYFYNLYDVCKDDRNYDLFKDFDPIRPPEKGGKPILYMDRLNMFLEYTGYTLHSSIQRIKSNYNVI